jgi:hypothetical protein
MFLDQKFVEVPIDYLLLLVKLKFIGKSSFLDRLRGSIFKFKEFLGVARWSWKSK